MPETKKRHMMATTAIHKIGDISRDKPDLCGVYDEDDENYIGRWTTGFMLDRVKFPKSTTRELTEEEHEKYNGMRISLGSSVFTVRTRPND